MTMPVLVQVAVGLPVILFAAALVVVVCFWLLVAFGVTALDAFDADADPDAWGDGRGSGVCRGVLADRARPVPRCRCERPAGRPGGGGAVTGLMRPVVSAGALLVAWRLACLFVRPLHRLFPDEPGSALFSAHDHRAV